MLAATEKGDNDCDNQRNDKDGDNATTTAFLFRLRLAPLGRSRSLLILGSRRLGTTTRRLRPLITSLRLSTSWRLVGSLRLLVTTLLTLGLLITALGLLITALGLLITALVLPITALRLLIPPLGSAGRWSLALWTRVGLRFRSFPSGKHHFSGDGRGHHPLPFLRRGHGFLRTLLIGWHLRLLRPLLVWRHLRLLSWLLIGFLWSLNLWRF